MLLVLILKTFYVSFHECYSVCVWRSEENLQEAAFPSIMCGLGMGLRLSGMEAHPLLALLRQSNQSPASGTDKKEEVGKMRAVRHEVL